MPSFICVLVNSSQNSFWDILFYVTLKAIVWSWRSDIIIIPFQQMWKWRLREIKRFARDCIAKKLPTQGSNLFPLNSSFILYQSDCGSSTTWWSKGSIYLHEVPSRPASFLYLPHSFPPQSLCSHLALFYHSKAYERWKLLRQKTFPNLSKPWWTCLFSEFM